MDPVIESKVLAVAHRYPAQIAGTKSQGAFPDLGYGADFMEQVGQYTTVSSPRYEAAMLALSEAWEHRPPAYSWERAVFENAVMPAARAELYAAWLEAPEQWEIGSDAL